MVDDSVPPSWGHLGGVVNGIIDVQLTLAMLICGQLGVEPRKLALLCRTTIEQQKLQGGPPDYLASRHFAAESLAATLEIMALPPPGRKAPPGRDVPFSVIHGGLVTPPAGEAVTNADAAEDDPGGGDDAA